MIWKTVAILLVTGVALHPAGAAEPPAPAIPQAMNAAEIQLALQKLDVLGRVLYVAAHPDDDGRRRPGLRSRTRFVAETQWRTVSQYARGHAGVFQRDRNEAARGAWIHG